jgi:probable HAF family extracellular repeat protein
MTFMIHVRLTECFSFVGVWELGPPDEIHDLPLISGDSSGAATAINDNGQIVGISGICDQAVGRHTAKHAVLWQDGGVTDIGNLGALFWNTPTAINQQGDIVGFAGAPNDPDGDFLQAFIWTVQVECGHSVSSQEMSQPKPTE